MKALLDLNILLGVFQHRQPFYAVSSRVVSAAVKGEFDAVISAHFLTTLDYVLARHLSRTKAREAVGWTLSTFSVASVDQEILQHAYDMDLPDFEEAVAASVAKANDCRWIVTRNESDFADSLIPATRPEDFLRVISKT